MKLSVIVPMYNESSIIGESVRAFDEYLEKNYDDYELISAETKRGPGSEESGEDL